jgi:sugar lactone lactonase YvrE
MSHGHHVHTSKATMFVSGIGNDLCCPFLSPQGKLHAIRQNSGSVVTIDNVGNTQVVYSTGGQPSGAVFTNDGALYVSDFGHSAVLSIQSDGQQDLVVGVYEDKPLKGPHSIFIAKNEVFFTDSGTFGETGLHNRTGSLFTISSSPSGQILKPLALETLAYPSGIAVSHDGKFVYVAEMMANRVLRFFQQPSGVYHSSVFYQLSGGVGPSCLALDAQGNLYVGLYDVKGGLVYMCSRFVIASILTVYYLNPHRQRQRRHGACDLSGWQDRAPYPHCWSRDLRTRHQVTLLR